jgi:RimJ/RimL family protein N-acetyltransferase
MAERKWQRLRSRLAREGALPTVRKVFADHVFRHSASVVLELRDTTAPLAPVRPDPDMRLVVLGRGDAVPPLCPFLARRRADFEAMLAGAKLGFFVLRHNVAVGCAWVALSDHHDSRTREHYVVAVGEAYHFSWLLDPAERRRGTALLFARWMVGTLREMGIHRSFAVVDRNNRASYRVLQRFGYRECGTLVRHFNILHSCWTKVSKYHGTLGLSDPRRGRRAA